MRQDNFKTQYIRVSLAATFYFSTRKPTSQAQIVPHVLTHLFTIYWSRYLRVAKIVIRSFGRSLVLTSSSSFSRIPRTIMSRKHRRLIQSRRSRLRSRRTNTYLNRPRYLGIRPRILGRRILKSSERTNTCLLGSRASLEQICRIQTLKRSLNLAISCGKW